MPSRVCNVVLEELAGILRDLSGERLVAQGA